jgi:hypothetical protein
VPPLQQRLDLRGRRIKDQCGHCAKFTALDLGALERYSTTL